MHIESNTIHTWWDICDTPCQTLHPSNGKVGYAEQIKCWRNRISLILNQLGSVDSDLVGGAGGGARCRAPRAGAALDLFSSKTQFSLRRVQTPHLGVTSSHLTFRRLQLRQPFLDLRWPFRGIGRRLVRMGMSSGLLDPEEERLDPVSLLITVIKLAPVA